MTSSTSPFAPKPRQSFIKIALTTFTAIKTLVTLVRQSILP